MTWHSVVTGGTKGIGRAIVENRLAHGDHVVAVASSEKTIGSFTEWLAQHERAHEYVPRTRVIQADLSSVAGVDALVRELAGTPHEAMTLYCNAGVHKHDHQIEAMDEHERRAMTYLNANAIRDLIGKLVPARVVTISSTGAHWEYPGGDWYHSTKRRAELDTIAANEIGVDARVVAPGNVDTDTQSQFDNKKEDLMSPEDAAHFITGVHDTPYLSTLVLPVLGARYANALDKRVKTFTVRRDEALLGGTDSLRANYERLVDERYKPLKPQ